MGRRRMVASVDTSDRLANVVLASLGVALLALLGLVAWLGGEDQTPDATATEGVERVPGTVRTEGAASEPSTDEQDPDRPGDDVVVVPGDDAPPQQDATPDRPQEPVAPPPANAVPTTAPSTPPADAPADQASEERTPGAPAVPDTDQRGRVPALVVSDEPIDLRTVLADLDDDGTDERVSAYILRNGVYVQVERAQSDGWRTVSRVNGAVADDLVALRVEDLTGDGRPEVHTKQRVGRNGESVTLWSYADDRLRPMPASGGCWDGGNTFGIIGALVDPGQVAAICDESPLPQQLWPTAVYRWVDGRWTFEGRTGVHRG